MRTEIPHTILHLGQPVQGASVQVNLRSGGAAQVYADEEGGTLAANPITTDAQGRVGGWLERGAYVLVVTKAGMDPQTIPYDSAAASDQALDTNWYGTNVIPAGAYLNRSIAGGKIALATIQAENLAPDAALGNLDPGSLYTELLEDDAVDWTKLAPDAVRADNYQNGSFARAKAAVGVLPELATAFPAAGLYDGYQVAWRVPGNTHSWHLVYDSAGDATYPWRYLGGPALRHYTAGWSTGNVAGTATYTELTPACAITIPRTGVYRLTWGWTRYMDASGGSPGNQGMNLARNTTMFDEVWAWSNDYPSSAAQVQADAIYRQTAYDMVLDAGDVMRLRHRQSNALPGYPQFYGCWVEALPLRVV